VHVKQHDVGLAARDPYDRWLHVIGLADDVDQIA